MSRALDEGGTKVAERRLRSTLAHEAGTGCYTHTCFALGEKPKSAFRRPRSHAEHSLPGSHRCTGGRAQISGHWSEFQANRAIGALLMPKPLVDKAVQEFCVEAGKLGQRTLAAEKREAATTGFIHNIRRESHCRPASGSMRFFRKKTTANCSCEFFS